MGLLSVLSRFFLSFGCLILFLTRAFAATGSAAGGGETQSPTLESVSSTRSPVGQTTRCGPVITHLARASEEFVEWYSTEELPLREEHGYIFRGIYKPCWRRAETLRISMLELVRNQGKVSERVLQTTTLPVQDEWSQNPQVIFSVNDSVLPHGSTVAIRVDALDARHRVESSVTWTTATDYMVELPPVPRSGEQEVHSGFIWNGPKCDETKFYSFELRLSDGSRHLLGQKRCSPIYWLQGDISFIVQLSGDLILPGDLFTFHIEARDFAGNVATTEQAMRRLPVEVKINTPQAAEEVSTQFKVEGSCTEYDGPVRVMVVNSAEQIVADQETTCSGSFKLYSSRIPSSSETNYRIVVVHGADEASMISAAATARDEVLVSLRESSTLVTIESPPDNSSTAGTPELSGTCSPSESIVVSPAPIVSVQEGQQISDNRFICSSAGRFKIKVSVGYDQTISLRSGDSLASIFLDKIECADSRFQLVNGDYEPDDQGTYCLVRNQTIWTYEKGFFRGADPSITRIGDYWYLVGTSDSDFTGDIPIFRTKNLVNWEFHSYAFQGFSFGGDAEIVGGPNDRYGILTLSGRTWGQQEHLCRLWDGQLFEMNGEVYLIFSATVDRTPGQSICRPTPEETLPGAVNRRSLDRMSVYLVSNSREDFLARAPFANAQNGRNWQPIWFAASTRGDQYRFDGGQSLGHPIPNSGFEGLHQMLPWGDRLAHSSWNANTVMGLSGFVFSDPRTEARHLIYNWLVSLPPTHRDFSTVGRAWNGNHIATIKLGALPFMPDQNSELRSLANRASTLRLETGRQNPDGSAETLPEGCFDAGYQGSYCIAEGGSVYFAPETSKYYAIYSRGGSWASSSYAVFYRMADTLEELTSMNWNEPTAGERILMRSKDRTRPLFGPDGSITSSENYGVTRLFIGPGNRTHAVFSRKYESSSNRVVMFKEISFNADGTIKELIEDSENPARNPDFLLLPHQ